MSKKNNKISIIYFIFRSMLEMSRLYFLEFLKCKFSFWIFVWPLLVHRIFCSIQLRKWRWKHQSVCFTMWGRFYLDNVRLWRTGEAWWVGALVLPPHLRAPASQSGQCKALLLDWRGDLIKCRYCKKFLTYVRDDTTILLTVEYLIGLSKLFPFITWLFGILIC